MTELEYIMEEFRVIVAGGRDFEDYELLCSTLDKLLTLKAKTHSIAIVSGLARGADNLGEKYAKERGYHVKEFPAQWDKYGKSAGYRRNGEMADNADACVAFWDLKSRGTKHMIDLAVKKDLKYRIVYY